VKFKYGKNKRNCEAAARLKKFRRTARRTVIKTQASGTFLTIQDTYVPLTVKLTSQN
jgi:hypothetical protein